MTSYPLMQAASVLFGAWFCLIVLVTLARWIVREWVAVWRQRPPIVRDHDGVWRAARRRRGS